MICILTEGFNKCNSAGIVVQGVGAWFCRNLAFSKLLLNMLCYKPLFFFFVYFSIFYLCIFYLSIFFKRIVLLVLHWNPIILEWNFFHVLPSCLLSAKDNSNSWLCNRKLQRVTSTAFCLACDSPSVNC